MSYLGDAVSRSECLRGRHKGQRFLNDAFRECRVAYLPMRSCGSSNNSTFNALRSRLRTWYLQAVASFWLTPITGGRDERHHPIPTPACPVGVSAPAAWLISRMQPAAHSVDHLHPGRQHFAQPERVAGDPGREQVVALETPFVSSKGQMHRIMQSSEYSVGTSQDSWDVCVASEVSYVQKA